jgi:cholesterol transport system auxiliary component
MKKIIFISLLLLAGCSSILPKGAPAPRQYTLNAPIVHTTAAQQISVGLQILQPQATPGLESERIILRRDDNRIDYFANAKWTSNLNALVQSLLVESFDSTHRVKSVGNDLVAMNPDYSLLIEIRDFQAEYISGNPAPRAHVRLVAKLIKTNGNVMIATNNYEEKEMAASDDLSGIIRAFDTATRHAVEKIVTDTLPQLRPTAATVKR